MIYSDKEIIPLNLTFNDVHIPVYTFDAVIVGSGAAGLSAAYALLSMGVKNIAIITESMKAGTSKNSGSSTQNYYNLFLNSKSRLYFDSVRSMARDLYNSHSMDGDAALTQSALFARCFYRLCDLGVDFPQNIYGEFISCGAENSGKVNAEFFTAKKITEAAQKYIVNENIPIFNRFRVVSIIKNSKENEKEENAVGLLAIDKDMQKIYADEMREYNLQTRINNANKNIFGKIQEKLNSKSTAVKPAKPPDNKSVPAEPTGNEYGYVLFRASNIIYAVGGPAGIYEDNTSLYPRNMTCSFGAAFMAGISGKNLTETIFGAAYISKKEENALKWKIEGDLLRVLPRYYSTNQNGEDEKEFLGEYFNNAEDLKTAMFEKSENWNLNLDINLSPSYSSKLDSALYSEINKNRRIFIDYRKNPEILPEFTDLGYNTENIYATPYERLISRNWDLYKLFLDNGIDLTKEPIEISLCAYHLNGGLDCDIYSESNLKHFFPVGETAAIFGVYLPDGASLAATQTTSFRAAEKIAKYYKDYNKNTMDMQEFRSVSSDEICKYITVAKHLLKNAVKNIVSENINEMRKKYQKRFSDCCMITRSLEDVVLAIADCRFDIANFTNDNKIDDISYLSDVFENHDILITQYVFLQAVRNYIISGGKSRGSYIILNPENSKSSVSVSDSDSNSMDFNELVSFVKIKSPHTFEIEFSARKVNDIPEI